MRNFLPVLTKKAEDLVQDLDPTNSMTFMRIKTKGCEYLVAPDKDYYLISVQADETPQRTTDKK